MDESDVLLIGRVVFVERIESELIGLVGVLEVIELMIGVGEMIVDGGGMLLESQDGSVDGDGLLIIVSFQIEATEAKVGVDEEGIEENSLLIGGNGLLIELGVLRERIELMVNQGEMVPVLGGMGITGEGSLGVLEGIGEKLVEVGLDLGGSNDVFTVEKVLEKGEFSGLLTGEALEESGLRENIGGLKSELMLIIESIENKEIVVVGGGKLGEMSGNIEGFLLETNDFDDLIKRKKEVGEEGKKDEEDEGRDDFGEGFIGERVFFLEGKGETDKKGEEEKQRGRGRENKEKKADDKGKSEEVGMLKVFI